MHLSNIKALSLVFLILSLTSFSLLANEEKHKENNIEEKHKKFEPGPFIIDHILDSYEWHIYSTPKKHYSVPLPIILISKQKGFVVFLSSKFHHGHTEYKGFYISQEGKNKGTILEKTSDGEIVKPIDLSFTKNAASILVSMIILVWLFVGMANAYKRNPKKAPTGMQNLLEPIVLFVRDDIARPAIGERKYEKFMPYLLTIFFFILLNNLTGLIPIIPFGSNVTGNIAVTFVLAFFTFIVIAISGNKTYWKHIFNAPGIPWWLKVPIPLMPIIEIVGVFIKPFVLMVRLFANIAAGHIVALGFFSLIFVFGNMNIGVGYAVSVGSIIFTVFMSFLELLVAFIQALVFTLLSAIYFGMAVEEH